MAVNYASVLALSAALLLAIALSWNGLQSSSVLEQAVTVTDPNAKWLAEENSIRLSTQDDISKRRLAHSQPIDSVLGDLSSPTAELDQREEKLRLDAKSLLDEANLDRTKAHILRMKSAADIAQAHRDLNVVESLDSRLQQISHVAREKRDAFKRDGTETHNLRALAAKLRGKAAKIHAKIFAMDKQEGGLRKDAEADRQSASKAEDNMDMVQEDLTTALVHRELSARAEQKARAKLLRSESKLHAIRKHDAQMLAKARAAAGLPAQKGASSSHQKRHSAKGKPVSDENA